MDAKGRNDQNKIVIFPIENYKKGQYVKVLIERVTITSLIGKIVEEVKFQEPLKNEHTGY